MKTVTNRLKLGTVVVLAGVCVAVAGGQVSGRGERKDNVGRAAPPVPVEPFSPSNARTADGKLIPAGQFFPASRCAACHQDTHRFWSESLHRNAAREPFYRESADILLRTRGIEFTRHCESCHTPVALFSGALAKESGKTSAPFTPLDDEGVTCSVCHSITEARTDGRGSFTIRRPALLAREDSQNASASKNVSIKVLGVSPPRIDALSTSKGPVGAGVTLTGVSLKVDNNNPVVTFAGGNNARIPASVTSASATEVRVIVPNNAVTGPIELTNAAGLAVTPSFIVEAPQDFQLTITPSATTAPQGGRATYVVYVTASKPDFTQLVSLSATGLQSGLTASFAPQQITAGASSTLTLMAPGNLTAGSYPFSIPGEADVEGAKLVRTAAATLNVTTAGQTMLAGRVLSTSKEPVIGATVSLDGKSAATDASGSFLLIGVTEGVNRPVMVDGRTASAPNRTYPVIAEPVDIVAGKVNEAPYTFYLPPIDRQHEMDVIPNQETRVTTPMVPGLTMTIPAGANLRNRDGSPVSRVSLTSVEIDRTPAPLPAGLNMGMVYTSQPGGAIADIPMPVVYPNLSGADPGTRVELYYFNHDNVKWERYGFGRVSQDGRTIAPEINPMTNRPYGLPNFSWHAPAPPPPPDTPPDTRRDDCPPPPPGTCPLPLCQRNRGQHPVDFSTGLKIEAATDISFGGARGGLELTRTYTTGLAVNNISGRFGLGAKDNYSIRLTGGFQPNGAGRFVGEEGATGYLFSYLRTDPDGALIFTSTGRASFLGDVIRKLSDGTFEYRHADGRLMRFDADGRLTAMVDRNGNTTTLTYSGNDLTLITDAVGRSIRLDYSNGRVISATDPLDRVWRYEYDGAKSGMMSYWTVEATAAQWTI